MGTIYGWLQRDKKDVATTQAKLFVSTRDWFIALVQLRHGALEQQVTRRNELTVWAVGAQFDFCDRDNVAGC